MLSLPYYLGLKAEALHLADRSSEALEAINEAYERRMRRFNLEVILVALSALAILTAWLLIAGCVFSK